MASWEAIVGDIDWDNYFDSDSSDIEDHFPGLFQKEDYFNLSITTNDLMEECADLFDLDDHNNFSDHESDEETLANLRPTKKPKTKASRP